MGGDTDRLLQRVVEPAPREWYRFSLEFVGEPCVVLEEPRRLGDIALGLPDWLSVVPRLYSCELLDLLAYGLSNLVEDPPPLARVHSAPGGFCEGGFRSLYCDCNVMGISPRDFSHRRPLSGVVDRVNPPGMRRDPLPAHKHLVSLQSLRLQPETTVSRSGD